MQISYLNFDGYDHAGPFSVQTLGSAGQVRNALQGYLLNKPFANVHALAALGDTSDDDASIKARVFMRENKIEGAVIGMRNANFITPMQPEVLAEALNYISEKQSSSLGAMISGQQDAVVFANSSLTPAVVAAWQKVAERTAEVKQIEDYFLYSAILSPPALPVTPLDSKVRRAGNEDVTNLLLKTKAYGEEELKQIPAEQMNTFVKAIGFPSAYIIEGGRIIQSALYNVAPVSQSGALLTLASMDVNKRTKAGRLIKKQSSELDTDARKADGAEITKLMLPELTQHFSALARAMQEQGRWLMVRTRAANSSDLPETIPLTTIARQLGFMEAGGLDMITLKDSSRPQQESPPFPILRF